jgi:membrane protease YdiL (CAAX protease family)
MNVKKLLIALTLYMVVVLSKRFWLGDLSGVTFWAADFACFVVIPLILFIWIRPIEFSSPTLPVKNKRPYFFISYIVIFQALACMIILLFTCNWGQRFGSMIEIAYPNLLPSTLDYASKLPSNSEYKLVFALYFGLTAGVVEEFFFRGVIKKITDSYKRSHLTFVVTSTLTFASIHWAAGITALSISAAAGFSMALLYLKFRDLKPLMLGHFLYDFCYFLV